ncbi:MAG: RraA family protein [Acidimicrobiales bacterium]
MELALPDPQLLLELGTATLGESGALVVAPRVHAAWPGARLAAPAYPVRCTAGDNLGVHVAVTVAPPGSVLVVDVGDEPERGYWGEVLTTAALARGLAGLVIDGGVRDVARLEALAFPVFASLVALRGATKEAPATVGAPVIVGAAPVQRGDWVVGDADGVVVIPGAALADVVARARARAAKEATLFEQLRAGATTVELLGLDAGRVVRDDEPG